MKITYLLPLCVLFGDQAKGVFASSCSAYDLPAEEQQKYHGDQVCDRAQYNIFQQRLNRGHMHQRLKVGNAINQVPNQKTVHCPLQVQDLKHEGQAPHVDGYNSVWIVENSSLEPIVLSWVGKDGIEYSAVTPTITPPQNDPKAILKPSQWTAIYSFDGHVFHGRSYDAESGNLGPVVIQHRLGLIPVGAKFQDLVCPTDDPEPLVNEVRDPEFQRTPPHANRACFTMDIGFRNMANCPLHGYYINSHSDSCDEMFKFHLGKNAQPNDFMWQWDSPTKFEGSFVGHSFAFRSAANPEILVDTVTLQPTRIMDCPELKNKVQINKVTKVGDLAQVSVPLTNQGDIATKDQQLDDILLHVDHRFVRSVFNETYGRNGTSTSQKHRRSPRAGTARTPIAGIDSF